MSKVFIDDTNLTNIANAIRSKNGSTDTYLPSAMAPAIEALSVGGIDTSDATATASDIANGVTAYVNGEKITGTLTQLAGAVGTNAVQVSNMSGNNGSYFDIILSPQQDFYVRNVTFLSVRGSTNLLGTATASDVMSGVTFSGKNGIKITGTHVCSGIDTSDATATESDIISGQTAYVNGTKITGTLVVQNYYTGTTTPESTTGNDGDLYFKVTG